MPHPLSNPCSKVRRAKRNLDEINDLFAEYRKADPYKVVRQPDTDQPVHQFRIEVQEEPPADLGGAIGEFAHNLRTALNQIVWQLSLLSTPTPNDRTTAFPIFWEFKQAAINNRLHHVADTDARDVIFGLQPYHRGDKAKQDLLWVLDCLYSLNKY